MRWPQSLRARLTLWYTLVLGAPLVAFAGASFLVLDRALLHRADSFLDDAIGAFTTELASEQQEEPTAALAIRSSLRDIRFHDMQLAVFDASGVPAAVGAPDSTAPHRPRRLLDAAAIAAELRARPVSLRQTFTMGRGDRALRVTVERATVFRTRYLVAAAYPLHGNRETMELVGTTYLIAIPLLLLIAAGGGYFLAARSLAPVAAMSAHAAEISATNLNERLPVGNRRDELGALAHVVNGLLERLEASFAQQRRFMADASHELRTPVAVLRTEADVTLSRPHRTEAEYRESVAVMRDAARRLGRIVDDLFLLARADAGHLPIRREPLYLEEIVDAAARAVRALAQERGVRIELLPLEDSPFRGDADLLGRLLLNLLDNAIKHSPPGGAVTLSLVHGEGHYDIRVADTGAGIPADAQRQIFDRFFRVNKARSREEGGETSGAGLGLAIARWVAEAHGGRLDLVRSDASGSEFRVTLPVTDDGTADVRQPDHPIPSSTRPPMHSLARLFAVALPLSAVTPSVTQQPAGYHVTQRITVGGDGGWDYLTVDTAGNRLFVSRGTHVQVVDLARNALVGDIPNTPGVHGVALVPELGRAFTSNGRDSSVTIVDLRTLAPTANVKVTGRNPDAIMYEPVSKRVFTFNGGSANATAIDPATGTVAGTVTLGGKPEAPVTDGTGRIYVNIEDTGEIVAFDARTLAVQGRWSLAPCEEPTGLAIDKARGRLFAACSNALMAVVDMRSGKVVTTVPIGGGADGAAFDPATGLAFSTNGGNGTVTVVHEDAPDKFSVVATVPTQRGARTIALDPRNHRVYTVSAEFGPAPAPTPERPRPRGALVPGTFTVLVLDR